MASIEQEFCNSFGLNEEDVAKIISMYRLPHVLVRLMEIHLQEKELNIPKDTNTCNDIIVVVLSSLIELSTIESVKEQVVTLFTPPICCVGDFIDVEAKEVIDVIPEQTNEEA